MSRYNVDFFDLELNNLHNDTIDAPSIDWDYLTPEASSFLISKTNAITKNNLVYFPELNNFLGIVTAIDTEDYQTRVSFKPFISIFNQTVMFDTDLQGSGVALETVLADIIKTYWVNSSDSLQNITTLVPMAKTSTTSWGFNLKSDTENMHHCRINFYSVLIAKALSKYGIAINVVPNMSAKVIELWISKTESSIKIDADLNNVDIMSFVINESDAIYNKLEIWNAENYTDKIYYYLHPNGSYDRNDTDRITPVILDVEIAEVTEETSFDESAISVASQTFSGINWKNNIELRVKSDDALLEPDTMKFGQIAYIYHGGEVYESVLTGKVISDLTTLVFGSVRVDLTKKNALASSQ